MYLVFPQPIFQGASAVEQFTPASFQSMVAENPQPGLTWLVSGQLAGSYCRQPSLCPIGCRMQRHRNGSLSVPHPLHAPHLA